MAERLERMADMGVEPAPLPPVGAEPVWSPDDILGAEESEPVPFIEPPAVAPELLEAIEQVEADVKAATGIAEIPNDGHYIGLRNGSQPGPDGWKAPEIVNCTMAEAEGRTHGSSELDADAEKLIAMGQDPGPWRSTSRQPALGGHRRPLPPIRIRLWPRYYGPPAFLRQLQLPGPFRCSMKPACRSSAPLVA